MKRNRAYYLGWVFVWGLCLAGASTVWSQPAPTGAGSEGDKQGHWQESEESGMGWAGQLNLTDDQIKKMKEERTKQQKDIIKLRADMETAHVDLWNEVNSEKPDTSKIDHLTKQIGEIDGKILSDRIAMLVYLRSILTPEQKKKMDAMQMRFDGERWKGMNNARHPMGGGKEK